MSIHLEVVCWSSEEKGCPAANLTSQSGDPCGSGALPVWESEKFCEFPQELVFRVNRGLPTRIEQLNLLSHPFKIASRIEIFTSSDTNSEMHHGMAGVRFERLGFVCFSSNEATEFTACELQEVQLPQPAAKVAVLRLVLHSCHQTRANVFSQVGLASVIALGSHTHANVALPLLPSPQKALSKEFRSHFSLSLASTSENPTACRSNSDTTHGARFQSPRSTKVWIPDTREYKTPEQICAEIQINKQLVQFTGDEKLAQPWISLEQEADRLMDKLDHNVCIETVKLKDIEHVSPSRMTRKNERVHGLSDFVKNFAALERQKRNQEEILWRQTSSSPRSFPSSARTLPSPCSVLKKLRNGSWQDREDLLWQFTESLLPSIITGTNHRVPQISAAEADFLEVVTIALDDSHDQVFIAACALLRVLLVSIPHFQDGLASKSDVINFANCLLNRLDNRDAAVRNASALTILKIAGSARTRGTFVTHLLLKHVECKSFRSSGQQLLALLKLLAALQLSYHCCANIDIAPKRIFGFLLRSNADQHENALVREAARDLVVVLCTDVDEEFVVEHFVRRLPQEQQQIYSQLLRHRDVTTNGISRISNRSR